jgi:hypothetical protein
VAAGACCRPDARGVVGVHITIKDTSDNKATTRMRVCMAVPQEKSIRGQV